MNRLTGKKAVEFESQQPISSWNEPFDQIKGQLGLTSDAKLAAALGVTRGYLCSVRKGRKGVSLSLAQKIHSILGKEINLTELQGMFVPIRLQQFARDADKQRQLTLKRANGVCQLCGSPAPFHDKDGNPFLEIHHITPLCDGGTDSADNLVALCPNCHRKLTINPTKSEINKLQKLAEKYRI